MSSSGGLTDAELTALSSVYVSCLSCSLIGSCSVFITSIVKRKNLHEQAKPLIQLALADLLASLCLSFTALINFLRSGAVWSGEVVCSAGLALSLTFFYISFLLVMVYACESAHSVQGWREEDEGVVTCQLIPRCHRRRRIDLLYTLVWLLPLIGYVIYTRTVSFPLMSLTPSHPASGNSVWTNTHFCNSCILFLQLHLNDDELCPTVDLQHTKFIRIFTLTSVLFVLISCTVTYWRLEVRLRRYDQQGVRQAERIWSSARYMILVIIFCWTPALLLIGLSFAFSKTETLFPLFIVQ
ncbi:transmembrane protein, partial [Clarias magur]